VPLNLTFPQNLPQNASMKNEKERKGKRKRKRNILKLRFVFPPSPS
jgi:hypothetical protein